jgi:hypothetical protein
MSAVKRDTDPMMTAAEYRAFLGCLILRSFSFKGMCDAKQQIAGVYMQSCRLKQKK